MKEVAKLVAVQVTDGLTCYGYLMNDDKKILVDTLLDSLKAGEKAKGRKTGITRKDIEKIVEREIIPYSEAFDTYEDALESLKNSMRDVGLLNRAIGCILNHKLEVVYKTESGVVK